MTENYPQFMIDPSQYRKSKLLIGFLIVFWIIWSIGSVFVSSKLLTEFSFIIFGFFVVSLVITLGMPAWLLSMNKKELITIVNDKIVISGGFLQFGKQSVLKSNFVALVLSKEGAGYSLMMIQKKGTKPYIVPIAPFVSLNGKMDLQKKIAVFFEDNGCKFAVVNNIN